MIQEYNCYGDGDMVAVKAGRGNWVRYTDHIAEVERVVKVCLKIVLDLGEGENGKVCSSCCDYGDSCHECLKERVMEELKK